MFLKICWQIVPYFVTYFSFKNQLSPHTFLLCNQECDHVGVQYRCPIWPFPNWIAVILYHSYIANPCILFYKHIMFFSKTFGTFTSKATLPGTQVVFTCMHTWLSLQNNNVKWPNTKSAQDSEYPFLYLDLDSLWIQFLGSSATWIEREHKLNMLEYSWNSL